MKLWHCMSLLKSRQDLHIPLQALDASILHEYIYSSSAYLPVIFNPLWGPFQCRAHLGPSELRVVSCVINLLLTHVWSRLNVSINGSVIHCIPLEVAQCRFLVVLAVTRLKL